MRTPKKINLPGDPAKGKRPSVRWEVRLPQPDGKLKYKRFNTQKEAERAAAKQDELMDAVKNGTAPKVYNLTVNQLLDEYEKSRLGVSTKLRPSSVKGSQQAIAKLRPFFGAMKAASVQQKQVEEFREQTLADVKARQAAKLDALKRKLTKIAADKRGVRGRRKLAAIDADSDEIAARVARTGPRATNKALAFLRHVYKFAQARRYVAFNPTDGVEFLKAPTRMDRPLDTNVLTVEEAYALLSAVNPEYRAAIMVLMFGGLRLGELGGLTWGDLELDRDEPRLFVRQQREGVTGKITEPKSAAGRRFVDLLPEVVKELRQHKLRTQKASPEFVFPYHGRRFRDNEFFPALRRAKLRRIRLHDLRHTAASFMIASGVDIAAVSRQLGHADVSITLSVYTHAIKRRSESSVGAKMAAFLSAEKRGGFSVVMGEDDAMREVANAS